METIGGMPSTGRIVKGPASNLVELDSDKGLKHTAIVFDPRFHQHHSLNASLQEYLGFMEDPGVDGLLRLSHYEPQRGEFVYPSGTVWSVAEIVSMLANEGEAAGIRAGLEICYLGAEILQAAEEAGSEQGVYSHGSLTPWRVFIRPDGQIRIAGYSLPQIDVAVYKEDDSKKPEEDSLRYAPPERLRGEDEDISSDLLALTLIGLELMMSKPVYDGLMEDILAQAERGEGIRRLYQWRNKLPASVREVLGRALSPDFDARYRSSNDYVYEVHDVLTSMDAEGPSLAEIMKKIRAMTSRGKDAIQGGHTSMLTAEQMAELAADLDGEDDSSNLPPPKRPREDEAEEEVIEEEPEDEDAPRWAKVSRPGRAKEEEKVTKKERKLASRSRPSDDGRSSQRDALKDRLRRSRDRTKPEPAVEPEEDSMSDRKQELRNRLRRSQRDSSGPPSKEAPAAQAAVPSPPPAPVEPEPEPAETGAAALLARLRGSSATKSSPKPAAKLSTPASKSAPPVALDDSVSGPKVGLEVEGRLRAEVTLPAGMDLAMAASYLSERYAPAPVNLSGQSLGCYRLEKDGRRLDTREKTDGIEAGGTLALVVEPNEQIRVTVEVDGDPSIRFETMISTSVCVRNIVAHLERWLKLESANWGIEVEGDRLQPYEILADLSALDGSLLRIVR
jgi:hypothetical protein